MVQKGSELKVPLPEKSFIKVPINVHRLITKNNNVNIEMSIEDSYRGQEMMICLFNTLLKKADLYISSQNLLEKSNIDAHTRVLDLSKRSFSI